LIETVGGCLGMQFDYTLVVSSVLV
jgi:hypothetical protein